MGDFPCDLKTRSASFAGFFFSFALESMEMIEWHTEETVKTALHSSYRIERQMKPLE